MRPLIGVIGGMGPEATSDFLRRLIAATPAACDQDHLHIIVDCDPSVPDRTAAIVADGEDPSPQLAAMAQRLEIAGAELLVMACNSAHHFADAIAAAVSIPLVDWPGVVADELTASGARRIGLLATTGTVVSRIYHAAFEARNAVVVVPHAGDQRALMDAIYLVKREGASSGAALRTTHELIAALSAAGVDAILLACTELSALPGTGWRGGEVHDAAEIVARHVVGRALAGTEPL